MSIGRNDLCPCGSGKKYKQCCLNRVQTPAATSRPNPAMVLQQAQQAIEAGNPDKAIALCREMLRQHPHNPGVLHCLALALLMKGDAGSAIEYSTQSLAASVVPDAATYAVRANACIALCDFAAAAADFRHALAIRPQWTELQASLGGLYQKLGDVEQAEACCREVLAREPGNVRALSNLGVILQQRGDNAEAAVCHQLAYQQQPQSALIAQNLASALHAAGQPEEAEQVCRQALALNPQEALAHYTLARIQSDLGDNEGALASYARALEINPAYLQAAQGRILLMHYLPGLSPGQIFAEQRQFAARFEAHLMAAWQPHANSRNENRRLRIGYVSGDFRHHAIAYFIEPILARHDKSRVEIFCYSNYAVEDAISNRIAELADCWVRCSGLNDDDLAARIRADRIDILIDLSAHTALNRLLVFARKPAPVQVTWMGYPGTTGLTAMDYRISDAIMDPEGEVEAYNTEAIIRLARSATFRPDPDSPPVNTLPALARGHVTFACLNNILKVNQDIINLWGRILTAVPGSRMLIGNVVQPVVAQRLQQMFAATGIGSDRLVLKPKLSMREYLELHHDIDLALDPFPYGGGTTTNHALWMGVPVVTLTGATSASRQGATLLAGAGLQEFITDSADAYVAKAVELAQDLPRLDAIRQSLRARSGEDSGIGATLLTRDLEDALFRIWSVWCQKTDSGQRIQSGTSFPDAKDIHE